MSTPQRRPLSRPGPLRGPARPISFRINLSEDEHHKGRLVATHARRYLADLLRDFIEQRYRALGLDDDGPPRRPARRKAM
jgi:hypothetical protein